MESVSSLRGLSCCPPGRPRGSTEFSGRRHRKQAVRGTWGSPPIWAPPHWRPADRKLSASFFQRPRPAGDATPTNRFHSPIASRVTLDPGDLYSLSAQPFFRLARQLAITAGVSYWHESEGSASYPASSDVISGGAPGSSPKNPPAAPPRSPPVFTCGSRGARVPERWCGLPIDATLTYERVLSATGGRVPGAETVRGGIRFYRRFW